MVVCIVRVVSFDLDRLFGDVVIMVFSEINL